MHLGPTSQCQLDLHHVQPGASAFARSRSGKLAEHLREMISPTLERHAHRGSRPGGRWISRVRTEAGGVLGPSRHRRGSSGLSRRSLALLRLLSRDGGSGEAVGSLGLRITVGLEALGQHDWALRTDGVTEEDIGIVRGRPVPCQDRRACVR